MQIIQTPEVEMRKIRTESFYRGCRHISADVVPAVLAWGPDFQNPHKIKKLRWHLQPLHCRGGGRKILGMNGLDNLIDPVSFWFNKRHHKMENYWEKHLTDTSDLCTHMHICISTPICICEQILMSIYVHHIYLCLHHNEYMYNIVM